MIDILKRIENMRFERNWTEYELSKKADIPQSTISSWYRKNQVPALRSLEKLSHAFGVTLSVMVADEEDLVELSSQDRDALRLFHCLTFEQRANLLKLLESLSQTSQSR
ncbi:MAG: helix-turn-helix transcriptional regulator [Lachnospiraceae bacterium]|nr:helix-turn-helix transcriptional regulator [Lachnospiraceae bacterium]